MDALSLLAWTLSLLARTQRHRRPPLMSLLDKVAAIKQHLMLPPDLDIISSLGSACQLMGMVWYCLVSMKYVMWG